MHSPITCLAIESWSPSGTVGRVTETTVSFEESHEFYRINYNHGACFTTEKTVQNAESLIDSSTKDKMWSDINRQKFVNFVKTGESEVIEVSQLKHDRLLLPRKRVESSLRASTRRSPGVPSTWCQNVQSPHDSHQSGKQTAM